MAKTKILGTAVTITSAIKVAVFDWQENSGFKPAALKLTGNRRWRKGRKSSP